MQLVVGYQLHNNLKPAWQIELVSRITTMIVRLHYEQLTAAVAARPVLIALQRDLRRSVQVVLSAALTPLLSPLYRWFWLTLSLWVYPPGIERHDWIQPCRYGASAGNSISPSPKFGLRLYFVGACLTSCYGLRGCVVWQRLLADRSDVMFEDAAAKLQEVRAKLEAEKEALPHQSLRKRKRIKKSNGAG